MVPASPDAHAEQGNDDHGETVDPRQPSQTGRTLDERIGALPQGLTRDELVAEVATALRGVPEGAVLLAAVSGGPDSTAMVHLLTLARPDLDLELVHVRHGLRDDTADAATAEAHARALEISYHEVDVDVHSGGLGPEAAAREARYDALLGRAGARGAAWLAIGHTADDQAETVLMNLVRGAGLRGLSGMRPVRSERRVQIVRPLLRIRRSDVAGFIDGEGLLAVADPTNRDPQQRRARARHEALPVLDRLAGGPGDAVASLNRLAELARIDTDALDALAAEHAARLVVAWGPTRAVRIDLLRMLPRALSGRIMRLMASAVGGDLTADAVGRVTGLDSGESMHIAGGAFVSCGGGWLGFAPGDLQPLPREPLVVPGSTALPRLGLDVHIEWPWPLAPDADPDQLDLGFPDDAKSIAQVVDEPPPGPLADAPPGPGPRARMWAVFSADVGAALVRGDDFAVRARRDGDRLRSGVGMRKLQDLLVDARVPRVCRDLVPVIVDEDDEPLWIPGVAQRVCNTHEPAGMRVWLAPGTDVE
jgi:tRNA(Ile)-lysidine synthase